MPDTGTPKSPRRPGRAALSIRGHLALLLLASALPAILLAAGFLALDFRNDRARLERDSIAMARAMVHAIDRELVSIEAAAVVLATSRRAQSGDVEAFREQAVQVIDRRIGANVVLSGPDGRQLMNTYRAAGEPLPDHGNPQLLREVFATGKPVISDLYVGAVARHPLMSVDVPVFRDGKVAYVLSIGEVPERFRAILHEQQLPPGWIGAVLDRRGTIVARTEQHERFVGQPAASALVARVSAVAEGAVETDTLEGIPVISAFSRSPETGWSVALGIPRASLTAQVWRRTGLALAAAIVILGMGLALAWGIGGSIAASIRGLLEPASEIGRRDEISVPPLGLREADEVGEALVRASRMIALAQHRAQHDPLTGLANRSLFREMATHSVELSKRSGAPLSILFLDLDGFKEVNDTLGHDAGDRLLCAVGERLRSASRDSDVVARVGGDEFAMLLEDMDAAASAAFAFKLTAALSEPYEIDGATARVSASIGCATYPENGIDAHELMKRADEAMYRIKAARRVV